MERCECRATRAMPPALNGEANGLTLVHDQSAGKSKQRRGQNREQRLPRRHRSGDRQYEQRVQKMQEDVGNVVAGGVQRAEDVRVEPVRKGENRTQLVELRPVDPLRPVRGEVREQPFGWKVVQVLHERAQGITGRSKVKSSASGRVRNASAQRITTSVVWRW